jgi:hypothetical protein
MVKRAHISELEVVVARGTQLLDFSFFFAIMRDRNSLGDMI